MSPEAQRIAIAEACGWTVPEHCITKRRLAGKTERQCKGAPQDFGMDPTGGWHVSLPDYLNDLNAMHEAEKVLTDNQQAMYAVNLYRVLDIDWIRDDEGKVIEADLNDANNYIELAASNAFAWLVHATAAQRAEAFLRTIGKWPASPPSGPKEAGE